MWMFLACAGLALAQTPPESPGDPVESAAALAFHDQLGAAKTAINRGANSRALALLEELSERLHSGEQPPLSIAQEALVFLGDLRYLDGDQDGAREVFHEVLLADPAHVISPYHHTQDVRAFFALVREQVEDEIAQRPDPIPIPPPAPPPLPLVGYAPFGIPQLSEGRATSGVVFGGLQIAFAATSISTYILIDRANGPADRPGGHPFNWTREEIPQRVRALRYGVQWPSSALFYATWVASVIDANQYWNRSHRAARPVVYLTPNSIGMAGRF